MEMLQKIRSLEQERFRGNSWVNESIKSEKSLQVETTSGRMEYGKLYQFKYFDPKTMDAMSYWNTNPIVIKVGEYTSKTEGILDIGLNLNFFPVNVKMQFIDVYWNRYHGLYESTTIRSKSPKDQGHVKFNTNAFNSIFKPYGVGFVTRRYINSRISDMRVFSNDIDTWASAMHIKHPRFNGIGVSTRDKLFAKYINKTR